MKIIERFKDANKAWRLNYTFFSYPFLRVQKHTLEFY